MSIGGVLSYSKHGKVKLSRSAMWSGLGCDNVLLVREHKTIEMCFGYTR